MQLMGYFPKRIEPKPEWLKAPNVVDVCSVSSCISKGPEDWIDQWRHNDWWLYSLIEDAISVIPSKEIQQYTLFAYRLESVSYEFGKCKFFQFPNLKIQPLPKDIQGLGFDVVSRSVGTSFECSPLSCNHMAEEIAVNPRCLLDSLDNAKEIAVRFSIEEPEPGPYFVAEVIQVNRW